MVSKYINEDNWLSEILGKPAFIIQPTTELLDLFDTNNSEERKWLRYVQKNPSFAFCKVDPIQTSIITNLESVGFNLIDTNITLENLSPNLEEDSKFQCCFANSDDKAETMKVAANSFVYSRFHLDHRISNHIANKVKELWVGNFFSGERGTHMVLAKDKGIVVGFLQIIVKKDHWIIDLIAVSNEYRKQGIAKNLIAFANANILDVESIIVGTQIANIPSINLYLKLGFRFKSAKYVFHYNKN